MSLPNQEPKPQAPAQHPTQITQPNDPEKAKRELDYKQRVEYLKKLFPQLEAMPEWELSAIDARIRIILTQREEAEFFVDGADIAYNGEELDEG